MASAYDNVFPVFGGNIIDGNFEPIQIYGTAFYMKNNFFMTCAHTLKNAELHECITLGFFPKDGDSMMFANVLDFEIFKKNDSGIIEAQIERAVAFKWHIKELLLLNNVSSVGYPYGLDMTNLEVKIRGFKGHISMVGENHSFSKSPHYELSFQVPKGLSGAPLLYETNVGLKVCGMTIGNEITDMIVDSFKEKNNDGDEIVIYERTESLHRGIAIQSQSHLTIKSRILNQSIHSYLKKNKLL